MYLPENKKRNEWLAEEERNKAYAMSAVSFAYKNLDMTKTFTVLDIGCGRGHFTTLMNYFGRDCVGIDKRLDFEGNRFAVADMSILPFGDETFDLVHEHMALTDVKDFQNGTREDNYPVLEEIHRVLKPGGYYMGRMYYDWLRKTRKFKSCEMSEHFVYTKI